MEFYRTLGKMRKDCSALAIGDYLPLLVNEHFLVYIRKVENSIVLTAVNCGDTAVEVSLPEFACGIKPVFGNPPKKGVLTVAANGFALLKK